MHRPSYKLLETFFASDSLHEEAMDFAGVHGFLTAQAIAPVKMPKHDWWPLFTVEPPVLPAGELQALQQELKRLAQDIASSLYHDQKLWLPCRLSLGADPDDSDLRSWACGFMEALFIDEAAWFAADEATAGELLSPIMLASGLFDDETDNDLREDPQFIDDCCKQIPDAISALYLFYQAPSL